MPLGTTTRLYGVNDGKVYKLTSDVSGSAPVYATGVDVPGIKSVDTKLEMETKTLRGDNTLLAADSVFKGITGSVKYARHSFDVWGALTTAAAAPTGTTPNMKQTFTLTQSDLPAFAKFEGQSKQTDYIGGDVHVLLWKLMPGTMPLGFNEEDYMEQSFDFTSVPLLGTPAGGSAQSWLTIVGNETVVAVP
jgi:hypothetical protein